jgi:hypothetical protein
MLLGAQEFTIYMVRPLAGQVAYALEGASTTLEGNSRGNLRRRYRLKPDVDQFANR